ncbi:MAG: polysaccharide deacetylase family protein [Syntrophales bacterium]
MKQAIKIIVSKILDITGILFFYSRVLDRRRPRIVNFHRITEASVVREIRITPQVFRSQIEYLSREYNIIHLEEMVVGMESGKIPEKSVALTFDDGYRDNYEFAFPVLREFSAPATIFVTTGAIDAGFMHWHRFDEAILQTTRPCVDLNEFGFGSHPTSTPEERINTLSILHHRLKTIDDAQLRRVIDSVARKNGGGYGEDRQMLSWEEIREMQGSGLVTIGAHTVTHPILTKVPRKFAEEEIRKSGRRIREMTGRGADFFAYPNGEVADFNKDIQKMVRASGYRAAFTMVPIRRNRAPIDLFAVPRDDIYPGVTVGFDGEFSRSLFEMHVSGVAERIRFLLPL